MRRRHCGMHRRRLLLWQLGRWLMPRLGHLSIWGEEARRCLLPVAPCGSRGSGRRLRGSWGAAGRQIRTILTRQTENRQLLGLHHIAVHETTARAVGAAPRARKRSALLCLVRAGLLLLGGVGLRCGHRAHSKGNRAWGSRGWTGLGGTGWAGSECGDGGNGR